MSNIPQTYVITNRLNGKVYIGKTDDIRKRWWAHKSAAKRNNNHLSYAIRQYGIDNFEINPIAYYSSNEEAIVAEIFWIAEMRKHLGFKNVYNETAGGEGTVGFHHSNESRHKISKRRIVTGLRWGHIK